MIHRIATILKDRIAAFTYVDKIGGLVRVARQQREGREIVIPVAGDVDEAYACDPATIRDMVPDDRYGCMVYFEDRGTTRITERTRGTSYRASLRLVCWVNTLKFGSDPTTADRILEQFTNDLNVGQPYNTDTLIGLKHSVEGFPQRGASIFSQYTYPEAERQYLLWPFDAFALDITATYRIKPGCEEAPVPDDDACWTPPTTRKRRNPSEFSCEELLDPVTGLTATQLGPECLDCEGGGPIPPTVVNGTEITGQTVTVTQDGNPVGTVNPATGAVVVPPCDPCPPTTVNGTESYTPTILVQQGGVEVGTLNPATGVHTVPECDPCDPLTVTLAGVEIVNEADPCGVDVALTCADTVDAVWVEVAVEAQKVGLYTASAQVNGRTSYENAPNHVIEWTGTQYQLRDLFTGPDWVTTNAPATPWAGVWVNVSDGTPIDGSVAQATVGDICRTPCDPLDYEVYNTEATLLIDGSQVDPCGALVQLTVQDGSAVLKDTGGTTLSTTAIPATSTKNVTAPDATVQLKDSAANNIGSVNNYLSGSANNLTAPDGSAQLQDSAGANIGSAVPVRSNQAGVVVTAPDGTVTVVDHLGDTIGSTTVKSNGTTSILVSDWEGEFPVLTENTPTYNDEGDTTTGWTQTSVVLSSTSSVFRVTQQTTGVLGTAIRAVTAPVAGKDWCVYTKIRATSNTVGAQILRIQGTGSELIQLYFNFNSVSSSAVNGTLSLRVTTAAAAVTNVVLKTGISLGSVWQDLVIQYDDKNERVAIYERDANGWKFLGQLAGTNSCNEIQVYVNNSTGISYLEWDWLTLVAPNIQSIGDSLTRGSTLFSPIVASALTNGDSTWQRWAAIYPSMRNNLIVNKGVGGNTIGQVEARIQSDVLDNLPALVMLSACSNDYGAGTSQADKLTNTQDAIDLCAAASVPVVLYNGTYCSAAFASNPAARTYYKESWDDYLPSLTGLSGKIDIMGALKDSAGYADALFTQSDNVHPNVTGYTRMGQWIAALPYA